MLGINAKWCGVVTISLLSILLPIYSVAGEIAEEDIIHQFSGSTPYGWLNFLQESPDFSEDWQNWDGDVNLSEGLLADGVKVSYPDLPTSPLLLKKLPEKSGDRNALSLQKRTTFEFPKGVNYIGMHLYNDMSHKQAVRYLFTLNNGEQREVYGKTLGDELSTFVGFSTTGSTSIIRLDILTFMAGQYGIDKFLWGKKGDLASADCVFTPVITSMECEDRRWLFDVEVGAVMPSDESWWCANDKDAQCGNYGETVSFGYFSMTDQTKVELMFQDQKNPSCYYPLVVELHKNCDVGCRIEMADGDTIRSCEDETGVALLAKVH
jgi:hypothetical protein